MPAIHPDHTVLPVADHQHQARDLAWVLGVTYEGISGPFAVTRIGPTFTVDFITKDGPVPEPHLAFRADHDTFDGILARLQSAGRPYGDDPADPANLRTSHPLAHRGLYWRAGGHLFEVMTIDA
ncbi:VOC family protein [Streptomyces sp. ME18-1-4]|uniref:VOC family protein n=1 Tax=Streptomyces sp. ME18-1-4 TaxID=3028685 RepID=UPI0029A85769|nr:VOC family protein [Streptomyces sp. ME18-1-4]MDX3244635.1 VOC family protein [Streptomyces sp. ME18-1-4]